jgi:hypothetical protein
MDWTLLDSWEPWGWAGEDACCVVLPPAAARVWSYPSPHPNISWSWTSASSCCRLAVIRSYRSRAWCWRSSSPDRLSSWMATIEAALMFYVWVLYAARGVAGNTSWSSARSLPRLRPRYRTAPRWLGSRLAGVSWVTMLHSSSCMLRR